MTEGKKFRFKLKSHKAYQAPVLLAVMALLAIVGIKIIFRSHAASPASTGTPVASLDQPGAAAQIVNVMNGANVAKDSDVQLAYFGNGQGGLGMTGIVMTYAYLFGDGGTEQWTGDSNVPLTGATHTYQAQLTSSHWVARAHAAGLNKLYLGFRLANYYNGKTYLHDWFDDPDWTSIDLPAIKNAAAAAKLMGFTGIYFDGEDYAAYGDTNVCNGCYPSHPTYNWNYPGNTHTEQQVRAQVKLRGQQIMSAMLEGYGPGIELSTYWLSFAGDLANLEQVQNNAIWNSAGASTVPNLLDGVTSVPGYGNIRFADASFYYGGARLGNDSTDMIIGANGALANMSQIFSNWAYASQRVSRTPFTWLGPTNGDGSPQSQKLITPSNSLALSQKANIYGMSSVFFNYDYGDVDINHYNLTNFTSNNGLANGNYEPAYQAVVAGIVDTTDPTLSGITVSQDNANTVHVSGRADDNLGIRAIRWSSGASSGAAVQQFVPDSTTTLNGQTVPDYTQAPANFHWHDTWVASNIPATGGQTIQLTVEDIKGRAVQYNVTVPGNTSNSADFNSDGHINISDLSILASHWGTSPATHAQGDANGDGKVDITDLSILASKWGT